MLSQLGLAADRLTRLWWRLVGRGVDLDGEHAWLRAPMGASSRLSATWLDDWAAQIGGAVDPDGRGLLDPADLTGPGLDPARLAPQVVDFYVSTDAWRMEVWTGWSWWARWPGGLVERWFGRRVGQLAIPTDPLAVARGLDSTITVVRDATGERIGAGWHRTLRGTGDVAFSGLYGTRRLPGHDRPSIHVAFPLPHGNVQVFARPEAGAGGALTLRSEATRFGENGTYVVVRHGRRTFAARVPLHERFVVHVDDEGVLRTEHELRLGRARVATLHYRLEPRPEVRTPDSTV